jgi:predicted site-specific integrase-resolvase
MAERARPERISRSKAGATRGYTAKTIQKLAQQGKIQVRALLGNRWRFDEQRLRECASGNRRHRCRTAHSRYRDGQ